MATRVQLLLSHSGGFYQNYVASNLVKLIVEISAVEMFAIYAM